MENQEKIWEFCIEIHEGTLFHNNHFYNEIDFILRVKGYDAL